jgi:hypothetical protein
MSTTPSLTTRPLRRLAVTVALAGVAGLGSIAAAPIASAAPAVDGPASVVERSGGNGPDAFLVLEHGKKPVFFCDADQPKKHQKKCVDVDGETRY